MHFKYGKNNVNHLCTYFFSSVFSHATQQKIFKKKIDWKMLLIITFRVEKEVSIFTATSEHSNEKTKPFVSDNCLWLQIFPSECRVCQRFACFKLGSLLYFQMTPDLLKRRKDAWISKTCASLQELLWGTRFFPPKNLFLSEYGQVKTGQISPEDAA